MKTKTTIKEYNDNGVLIKETVTEIEDDDMQFMIMEDDDPEWNIEL